MPKQLVRILDNKNNSLWSTDGQRELLRQRLNDDGFYVLTHRDSLEVYVVVYPEFWDL